MTDTLADRVRQAARGSEFLATLAMIREDGGMRFALGDSPVRPLDGGEIDALEAAGNSADDWSRVRVAEGFSPARVRRSHFHGDVVLGQFTGAVEVDGIALPAGIANSTLVDCIVGHDALIRDVRLLGRYIVGPGALVDDCGRVTCPTSTTFGNGAAVPMALESGGREVEIFAELDVRTAADVARPGPLRDQLAGYRNAVAEYAEQARSDRAAIGPVARVRGVDRLESSYIGAHAVLDGAVSVRESTLLSDRDTPVRVESGAQVAHSVLQWGSIVRTMALVERSVLAERVAVERQGKVTDSYLGSQTSVGAGEVTSCILGPLVACHHQSLLISTLWPGGKGNVGYGAMVGSNHTSRAPDQEFRAGEGLFVGLGAQVTFPCDLDRAPYSILACGVCLLPQQVTFPFSLIAPPQAHHPGVSPAYNDIFPGWVLAENLFALKRNEMKFRTRNRADRTEIDTAIFRPEIIDLMLDARQRLESVQRLNAFYTESDIPGLGKNVLLERDRLKAIAAYSFHIRLFGLLGLKEQAAQVLARKGPLGLVRLLTAANRDPAREYVRRLVVAEFGPGGVLTALRQLSDMLECVGREVERAREKDDARGERIIDDYGEVHAPASDNEVVRRTREEVVALQAEIEGMLSHGGTAARSSAIRALCS